MLISPEHRLFANIALIGMMGSGKSSVGRLLAERLGWEFIDTDAMIVDGAGKSIAGIFADEGEKAFRDLEVQAIASAAGREHCIIATGGGAVLRPENREALWRRCRVVWLKVSPDEAVARAANGDRRPLLESPDPAASARAILQQRECFYALADVAVDTNGLTAEETAYRIAGLWKAL
ncbi:MAG TPA: shikimate kinase [Armatimonadota bacterium]|nr:shikimate kinase [Armatimonadota bacterium]